MEQRLGQLSKCECQISCKWETRRPGSREPAQPNTGSRRPDVGPGEPANNWAHLNANTSAELKRDGQVWRDECNICSCHVSSAGPPQTMACAQSGRAALFDVSLCRFARARRK